MKPSQRLETYRFWDIVSLWSHELDEENWLVARLLVHGIVQDGLRFRSVDIRRIKSDRELRRNPYVGYSPDPTLPPVLLKSEVFEHLVNVFETGREPSREIVKDEYVEKKDFRTWIKFAGHRLPEFWFSRSERERAT